jgi:hypothetical protein
VSNAVCDHTSVLATIDAKWNLPACTYRDANANTVASFLDPSKPALLEPPMLADSGDLTSGEQHCDTSDPKLKVLPVARAGGLVVRFLGRHRHGVAVELRTRSGRLTGLEVELRHRRRVVARAHVHQIGPHFKRLALHSRHRLAAGVYTLVVRHGGRTLVRRSVHLGRVNGHHAEHPNGHHAEPKERHHDERPEHVQT